MISAKRGFDLIVAATGMLLVLPVLAAVALVIKLEDRGPADAQGLGEGEEGAVVPRNRLSVIHRPTGGWFNGGAKGEAQPFGVEEEEGAVPGAREH